MYRHLTTQRLGQSPALCCLPDCWPVSFPRIGQRWWTRCRRCVRNKFGQTSREEATMDIRTVAKRASVSTATVSRTVNRTSMVTPALARRVWKAVRELGYYPNRQARGLVSGRSRIFGLIVADLTNPFFPEIVQVFETLAVQHHYEILLASTMNDEEHMKLAARRMIERRVEGVAVATFGMEEEMLESFSVREIPLVLVDVVPARPNVRSIRIDYLTGIQQAVQHLAALRHRRIAFISGS